jgi:ribosomal protein S21
MSKKSNITVKPRKNESQERMVKRFIKKCKKKGIVDEVKDRRYFKSNSQKRNEIKRKRKRALAKAKAKEKGRG